MGLTMPYDKDGNFLMDMKLIKWGLSNIALLLGRVLVCAALSLILGGVYAFTQLVLPRFVDSAQDTFGLSLFQHYVMTAFLTANVLFNYLSCIFTEPGTPKAPTNLRHIPSRPNPSGISTGLEWRFCRTCDCLKPPRSHHCSVCRTCVLNMDHHCPWVNNCVGFYNYRYFVSFLFWITLGMAYGAATMLVPYLRLPLKLRMRPVFVWTPRALLSVLFPVSLSVCLGTGLLLAFHMYLVASAQTTIEMYKNIERESEMRLYGEKFRNPFSTGTYRGNFEQVFGSKLPWPIALLPSLRAPPRPRIPIFIEDASRELTETGSIEIV